MNSIPHSYSENMASPAMMSFYYVVQKQADIVVKNHKPNSQIST